MIREASCVTEQLKINFAITGKNYIWKYIKIEKLF